MAYVEKHFLQLSEELFHFLANFEQFLILFNIFSSIYIGLITVHQRNQQIHSEQGFTGSPVDAQWFECSRITDPDHLNNKLALNRGEFCTMWPFVSKGLFIIFHACPRLATQTQSRVLPIIGIFVLSFWPVIDKNPATPVQWNTGRPSSVFEAPWRARLIRGFESVNSSLAVAAPYN